MIQTDLFNLALNAIFLGFGVFILAVTFIRVEDEGRRQWIADTTQAAIVVVIFTSLAFLARVLADLYDVGAYYWVTESDLPLEILKERTVGPKAFFYWIVHVSYIVVPQLLWLKKIRGSKTALVLIATLFVLLNIGRIVNLVPTSAWGILVVARFVLYQLIALGVLVGLSRLLTLALRRT